MKHKNWLLSVGVIIIVAFVATLFLGQFNHQDAKAYDMHEGCFQYLGSVLTNYEDFSDGEFYRMYEKATNTWYIFPRSTWNAGMWAIGPTPVECPEGFEIPSSPPSPKESTVIITGFVETQK